MRVSLNWLKEFINIEIPSFEIAKILTKAGLEVDSIETKEQAFEGIVIGEVQQVSKHPEADKLVVASVFDGTTIHQVVCGAPNCRAGLKTAFAPIGAKLKEADGKEFKIKKTKLRGVESYGMLCSAKELNIGEESDKILELDQHLSVGTDLMNLYGDTIFEISLTPNLNHCTSVLGVARELSVITQKPLLPLSIKDNFETQAVEPLAIEINDFEKCPRYTARLIKNVKIQPSPTWMQTRLESAGIRPVNNVVDVTNYVLLELGHPLHAFDFDAIEGNDVSVRVASEGEIFKTLDGKERILGKEDLVIADSLKALAIAGVMGGENSEVSDKTTNVLLESAYFQPSSIRKTSKALGISTDASKRFERGMDPNQLLVSLNRATDLILEIAGGFVASELVNIQKEIFTPKTIFVRLDRVNQILGTKLSMSEVESIFHRFGYPCQTQPKGLSITVPTYRVDLKEEIDLIEEVARVYGYDNIPQIDPIYQATTLNHSPIFLFEREVRQKMIGEGLQELLTCDLIGPTLFDIVHEDPEAYVNIIKLMNPTSVEQSLLRTSLLPGLLQVVKYNFDHQNHHLAGFEIGRIHFKQKDHYKEQTILGIILTGKNQPHSWSQPDRDYDFYDLKGILENVLKELNIQEIRFQTKSLNTFHTGRQASIYVGSLEIGSFGEVHPKIIRKLDVPQRIYFAELNLHDVLQVRQPSPKMQPLAVYPSSDRDWTITVAEETPIGEITEAIRTISSKYLEEVELIDIYRSEKLGKDQKNVTFRFIYRDKSKTISQETVEEEHTRITNQTIKLIKEIKGSEYENICIS